VIAAGLLIAVALVSFLLAGLVRRYALARGALDHPNERSSHLTPTPRGGGIAFVTAFLVGLAVAAALLPLERGPVYAMVIAGLLVGFTGMRDDFHGLGVGARLLVQFTAAVAAFWVLSGGEPASLFGTSAGATWLFAAAGVFLLVWLVNLYNFMDGIDGIAAIEAITVGLGMTLVYLLDPRTGEAWLMPALLAAGVAGFLPWNFPGARLFMGDVGSGFLGMVLGILALQGMMMDLGLLWAWLILLGVFIVDASLTLIRRLLAGENVFRAHRGHAYQVAARRYGSHVPVSLAVGAINLLWLLPLAAWVARGGLAGPVGLLIAWTPLVALAVWFRADRVQA